MPLPILISHLIEIVIYILMIDVGLSWLLQFNGRLASNPLVKLIHSLSSPILNPVRRILPSPSKTGGYDLSAVAAILLLQVIRTIILGL